LRRVDDVGEEHRREDGVDGRPSLDSRELAHDRHLRFDLETRPTLKHVHRGVRH